MTAGPAEPGLRAAAARALLPMVGAAVVVLRGLPVAAAALCGVAFVLFVFEIRVPELLRPLDAAVGAVARAVGTVITAVALTAVWVVCFLPAWLIDSAVRRVRPTPRPQWRPATPERAREMAGAADPTRMWADPPDRGGRRGPIWLRPLAVLVVCLAAVWIVVETRRDHAAPISAIASGPKGRSEQIRPAVFDPKDQRWVESYAFAGQPWADQMFNDRATGTARPDPVLGWAMNDHRSRYVNVRGGTRVSYVPKDPTLTVWFFGGSTMFGDGQRDQHTIPSELARIAEADGLRIRPVNFGVDSYNNYQETMAFSEALTQRPAPDLVVFYDGANEWATADERITYGQLDPTQIYYQAANDAQRAARAKAAPRTQLAPDDRARRFVDLGATQYRRGVDLADRLGRASKVPVVHFWQPGLYSAPLSDATKPLADRFHVSQATLRDLGRSIAEMRSRSKTGAIDLSGALAKVDGPTYFDISHTNEVGARTIAQAIYDHLKPQLDALAPG